MSGIINENLLAYLVVTGELTIEQAVDFNNRCTSFNNLLMIKYKDEDYEKCEEEISTSITKYVNLLVEKYKTGWTPNPKFIYEEKEITGICFECGVEGKCIGEEGDDWLCVDCSSISCNSDDEEDSEEDSDEDSEEDSDENE